MTRSETLFQQALKTIPGGVNSPVRAFSGVGGTPVFVERAQGAEIVDVDGNSYVDYIGSWGPMILGHAHPAVVAAVQEACSRGLSFGTPTEIETRIAEKVCAMVPGAEQVRMVSSGTEAAMTAVRMARGITGRNLMVKFEGCYHGHVDSLLVKAGSGVLTLGIPGTPGVPSALAELTITAPYNDSAALAAVFAEHGADIAAVILEPVAGNMNCIPPLPGFLEEARRLTSEAGALLIFDEVMTGFRLAPGGAQELYGITPDISVLGKVIGGGMPVGAVAGPEQYMSALAPAGNVYQAGTLSGNPIAMTAGLKTLELVSEPGFHADLMTRTTTIVDGLRTLAGEAGVPMLCQHVPGMFGFFFTDAGAVSNFQDVSACDVERFRRFYHLMLERGVYLAPSAFEAGFVSAAHNADCIDRTLTAARESLALLR